MAGLSQRQSVVYSLWALLLCTIFLATVIAIFYEGAGTYLRFGPNEDLTLMGMRLNTWKKWRMSLLLICIVKGTRTAVGQLGTAVLGFSVYNPEAKVITEFTKNELQFFANAMFVLDGINSVMMGVVGVAQIDLALFAVLFTEFISLFTIRRLLNVKIFPGKKREPVGDEKC